MRTCEGSATQALDPTSCGSFDFARRLASLRMTLACEGSATQALEATRCGSFDFARRLASLRMTLHSGMGSSRPRKMSVQGLFTAAGGSCDRWIPQDDMHARRSGKQVA